MEKSPWKDDQVLLASDCIERSEIRMVDGYNVFADKNGIKVSYPYNCRGDKKRKMVQAECRFDLKSL